MDRPTVSNHGSTPVTQQTLAHKVHKALRAHSEDLLTILSEKQCTLREMKFLATTFNITLNSVI